MGIEAKIQTGNSTPGLANVDTNNNAQVNLPYGSQGGGVISAGFATLLTEVDAGDITGERDVKEPETTNDYRLRSGLDQIDFYHTFEGTNIARDKFVQTDSTMTAAQTGGWLIINSGNATASGNSCNIRTYKPFVISFPSFSLYQDLIIREPNYDATNAVSEWGFGFVSGTSLPTDGVFFRRLSGGALRGVLNFNGSETEITIDPTNVPSRDGIGLYDPVQAQHYLIDVHLDIVEFWINDKKVGFIEIPAGQGLPTQSNGMPSFWRVYNSGTASAARRIEVAVVGVAKGDMFTGKDWRDVIAGNGGGAYQTQAGSVSGSTVTRGATATAGHPNSTQARGAGTWTPTTAPAINSFGGQWVSPAISTLTSEADYPVFSFLNPAGTASLPGKILYITGIKWGKTVATAAASSNPINLNFILGIGGTSSATTQTESATVVASRTKVLDTIPFKSSAVIGDYVEGGHFNFLTPEVVYPGTYLVWIVRPFGTVTSNTLVVAGSVAFNGYFE